MTENIDSSQNHTQTGSFGGAFDTQAIAALANQDFEDMDTKMIAQIAGDDVEEEDDDEEELEQAEGEQGAGESLHTPLDSSFPGEIEVEEKVRYLPLPPEGYEPTPLRPWRDPEALAQNKLPFMTPIVERTESSLAPSTIFGEKDYFNSKTPSRHTPVVASKNNSPSKLDVDGLLLGSPQKDSPTASERKRKLVYTGASEPEVLTSSPKKRIVAPSSISHELPLEFSASRTAISAQPVVATPTRSPASHKGPVIDDFQCNPCTPSIKEQILSALDPPLSLYSGYNDNSMVTANHYQTMKLYADKIAKQKGTNKNSPRKPQNDKTTTKAVPPILKLRGTNRVYAVKRELGQGAFAPVYLVDSYDPNANTIPEDGNRESQDVEDPDSAAVSLSKRHDLEALKTECPPATLVWEFHILRLVKHRIGPASRTMQSLVTAHECHLYRDEAYLILSYSPQGTLLDLVNHFRREAIAQGKPSDTGMPEELAMFFSIELLRTLEDLHHVGILHGDLKADNCLVRLPQTTELKDPYSSAGFAGWDAKGMTLIDFGRGIDVRAFSTKTQFIADWDASPQDCAEIRECRPWKFEIDYHGAAGVMHSLLFGKYIETVPAVVGPGGALGKKKEWRLKESLKRYWERDVWGENFGLLLNPGVVEDGEEMPVQKNLRRVRERMESWLEAEGEKGARDLRAQIRRAERLVGEAGKKGR